jgi:tol-pal system protein YbgF
LKYELAATGEFMNIPRTLRNRILPIILVAGLVNFAPARAHAVSKEIVELQTQVQQLLDMVQRLQSTMDTRFGVIQHLVEQTADSTNRMSSAVSDLQQKIAAQNEAISGKIDSSTGSVQSLSDSVDELKARLSKLQDTVNAMQSQLQNMQAPPPGQNGEPGASGSPAGPGTASSPAANQAPPLQETYQAGIRDFNGAKYSVAQGEFQDVVQYYPNDDLAGQAQFYLGEIAYRQQNYSDAIKSYNTVLENFPNSSKAAAAQLHKGLALLAMNRRTPGIEELRTLIRKHPQTPEAAQARSKLNGMGIRITATR